MFGFPNNQLTGGIIVTQVVNLAWPCLNKDGRAALNILRFLLLASHIPSTFFWDRFVQIWDQMHLRGIYMASVIRSGGQMVPWKCTMTHGLLLMEAVGFTHLSALSSRAPGCWSAVLGLLAPSRPPSCGFVAKILHLDFPKGGNRRMGLYLREASEIGGYIYLEARRSVSMKWLSHLTCSHERAFVSQFLPCECRILIFVLQRIGWDATRDSAWQTLKQYTSQILLLSVFAECVVGS